MIELRGVAKRYGDDVSLERIDLQVKKGELLLLRGPSGSGKTTLLQILGLLVAPSEGEVIVDGKDVAGQSDREVATLRLRTIGHVFQSHNMIPDLTLLENVLIPMRLAGSIDPARGRSLLDAVGLASHADRLPSEVSVGERQRAAVARALVMRPRLVLADEPTASLDAARAEQIVRLLLALRKEHGHALVIASHDPRAWALLDAPRIVELDHGKARFLPEKPAVGALPVD